MIKITVIERIEHAKHPLRSIEGIKDKAQHSPEPLPQCEAIRKNTYAPGYEAAHPDKRCERRGRYSVEGIPMCSLHAGEIALGEIIKETEKEESS